VMLPQQPPYAPTQMPYLSDQLLRRFFIPHALPPFLLIYELKLFDLFT